MKKGSMNYRKKRDSRNKFSAFSGESCHFNERYQATGMISGEESRLFKVREKIAQILRNRKLSKTKSSEVRKHRYKIEAAQLSIEKAVDLEKQRNIRIDVLLWDTYDQRHSIPGRDDLNNLERICYKILRHIAEKWRQNNWKLYPDNRSMINWTEIKSYLSSTHILRLKLANILTLFKEEVYNIIFYIIEPKKSHDEPLIQLADLFAGIACFCRESGEEFIKWLQSQKGNKQKFLFEYGEPGIPEDLNKTKQNRFRLVGYLNDICKRYGLGVCLRTKKYLWTPDPSRPINFWNYESQYEGDKPP